jgi:hypothetical protein
MARYRSASTNDSRDTLAPLHFHPEQTQILRTAFSLVCRTFERERRLRAGERTRLARAVFAAAEGGPLNADQLATKAILMAIRPSPRRPA